MGADVKPLYAVTFDINFGAQSVSILNYVVTSTDVVRRCGSAESFGMLTEKGVRQADMCDTPDPLEAWTDHGNMSVYWTTDEVRSRIVATTAAYMLECFRRHTKLLQTCGGEAM